MAAVLPQCCDEARQATAAETAESSRLRAAGSLKRGKGRRAVEERIDRKADKVLGEESQECATDKAPGAMGSPLPPTVETTR